jgi:hypothetical protein
VRFAVVVLVLVSGCYQSHELGRDAGPLPDAGVVTCDRESIPAFTGAPCSDAVNACRAACADEPCREACLDAPCRACRYQTLFHCANEAGCEELWRAFACCVESVPTCSALRGFERTSCAMSCPMQFDPYAHCIESMGGMACFMRAAATCNLR